MKYHFVINGKNYEESTGLNALNIVRELNDIQPKLKNTQIYFCANIADLYYIKSNIDNLQVRILAQGFQSTEFGPYTGQIHAKSLLDYEADGSLLNHSENQLEPNILEKNLEFLQKNNLISILCASDLNVAEKLNKLNPDFLAIEPSELIGGDISVSKANPDLIKKGVDLTDNLLVGAGIKNKEDIEKALELGSKGVLVASGIWKSNDVKKTTVGMLKGFGEIF